MNIDRRGLLTGATLAALAATTPVVSAAKRDESGLGAVFVPGYFPDRAFANGKPVVRNRRLRRGLKEADGPVRLLTRIGMDGSIRQGLLPVLAHDVEIAPDGSTGVLCGMDGGNHCAFDPKTLELAALQPSFRDGWRGGGHAVYLDGGRTVVLSERAPAAPYQGRLEAHFGRLTIRDPASLKQLDSYSTHGVDPHDIRLTADGRHVVIANYGSIVSAETGKQTVPRTVIEASITVLELSSGKLVDKLKTGRGAVELRHLAAGNLDRIFAIQARLGNTADGADVMRAEDAAYEDDITAEADQAYLAAATLRYDALRGRSTKMGGATATRLMRHGLSIRFDERYDEAIATYPSSHYVMVFDGATGSISRKFDTRTAGLRYPCGLTFLPDGRHYAVAGYWENLFVFERGTHRLVRDLCLYPLFFGHSHITAA